MSPSLLDYLEPETIRELPPWIRRFLSRCQPKRVVRVPVPMNGQELHDRDWTIRHEHRVNREDGMGWRESVRMLARRHGLTYSTVEHILRPLPKPTVCSNPTQGVASNVTTSLHVEDSK